MAKTNLEDAIQNTATTTKSVIKNRMFDLIAVGILIAMLALNIGVLELRQITIYSLINILLECVPFFLTSVLLSVNFYHKGTFTGKSTEKFVAISKQYSSYVTDLTGTEVELLPEFCTEYNNKVLQRIQTDILKSASISYERFNNVTDNDGVEIQPLKVLTKAELLKLYSKERVKIILKAKRVKIKGLNENLLLGNHSITDSTDIGEDEHSMDSKNTRSSAVRYLLSTLFLSLIGIRDILAWGWAGLLIAAFKLIYILCSSYMKHFKGYNDITVKLVNHIARKTDILKQFKQWCESRKTNEDEIAQLQMRL